MDCRRGRRVLRLHATCWVVGVACGLAAAIPAAANAQPPTAGPPTVVDGPNAGIVELSGMSVARDGTGGLVYLKDVGGVQHVFVSQLATRFQSPQQVDAGLPGPSSQPVIAAGNGGLLLVAFINTGVLYVVDQSATGAGFGRPIPLATGSANPAIAITNLGKAYLAFTTADGGGDDVRCAYYYQGSWGVEPGAFNAMPADDAGTGSGRPAVTAAGDGVGILVWGESGHIFSRRVWGIPPTGTGPSTVYEEADVPSLNGWNELSAADPVISSGGNSSYAAVAFQEEFSNGSQQQSRVLMRRLRGSLYEGVNPADGLSTPDVEGAHQPGVESGEYGDGFVTSARDSSHELIEMRLASNEAPGAVARLDSLPNASSPYAAPTASGYYSALIGWQESALTGDPEIRARFFDGTSFGPEEVLSSPILGPTDAADGLFTAGDIAGDVAVAWVQGPPGSRAIVAAQLYQEPGSFHALQRSRYVRSTGPLLSWSPSRASWGVRYMVSVDGVPVGQTRGTSLRLPTAQYPTRLTQGPHSWQVTAVNPAGIARSDAPASVFVDTIPPAVGVRLTGKRKVRSKLQLTIRATDAVGVPPADASGIDEVQVKWGDGGSNRVRGDKIRHVYAAARRYRITVTVTDRAGNKTTVVLKIKITRRSTRRARHG